MAKEFQELYGQRIYLEIPKKEDAKLIVDENTKEALQKEMLKKMSKMTIYAVGSTVTHLKEGEIVLVDPGALSRASVIPLSDKRDVLMINSLDIIHKW